MSVINFLFPTFLSYKRGYTFGTENSYQDLIFKLRAFTRISNPEYYPIFFTTSENLGVFGWLILLDFEQNKCSDLHRSISIFEKKKIVFQLK